MKKSFLFKTVLFSAVALLLVACEPESEPESETNSFITFEDVALDSSGYWNGSDLSGTPFEGDSWGMPITVYKGGFVSGILTCSNEYNDTWGSWSSFACTNHTNMDSVGFMNEYSVYAVSGANGSQQFATLYFTDTVRCEFAQEVSVKSLMFNNSTYVYKAIKEGRDGYTNQTQFTEGDFLYVTVTGYDASNVRTDSVNLSLAEFRNGASDVCSSWTKQSLVSLGKVKKLTFNLVSSDFMTPSYICIDNIEYAKD